MRLSVYSYTNRGGRDHNEDSIGTRWDESRGLFVLADGLGGHRCGEVASALAVEQFLSGCLAVDTPDEDRLAEAFHAANEAILAAQDVPGQEEMKTTAVVLCLRGDRAVWGHIGDSRLYRFSGGQVQQLTRDHSVTYMKYLGGEITYMDICHDDDRSSLLRVLGKANAKPESDSGTAAPGDAFLLCSDGFWEYVYREEMLADWLKARTPEEWVQTMLLRHIRRTPEGNDNFSVIAVFVEETL